MKYSISVTINKDLAYVLKEFQNKETAFKWIEGLKELNLIEGEENKEGSKYEMVFESKGKTQKMIETLEKIELPNSITTRYQMGKVNNLCINKFSESSGQSIYTMDTTFVFPFPQNILMMLFKSLFKMETKKGMIAFKNYIESL
ncbi:hypothetical protein CI105_08495 [Candidatus Izimaplasma bacterium ZiA1]|uniref:hypothetical protein n=1 Tax=Candidatus Izimoplasma sp. ZiA1 TaxID=2024899 RepID=UPI000BAA4E3C|nr:hypothetical protein CI105_08495 [Candidatus Izimaplasma bacterium ZiA1]